MAKAKSFAWIAALLHMKGYGEAECLLTRARNHPERSRQRFAAGAFGTRALLRDSPAVWLKRKHRVRLGWLVHLFPVASAFYFLAVILDLNRPFIPHLEL